MLKLVLTTVLTMEVTDCDNGDAAAALILDVPSVAMLPSPYTFCPYLNIGTILFEEDELSDGAFVVLQGHVAVRASTPEQRAAAAALYAAEKVTLATQSQQPTHIAPRTGV